MTLILTWAAHLRQVDDRLSRETIPGPAGGRSAGCRRDVSRPRAWRAQRIWCSGAGAPESRIAKPPTSHYPAAAPEIGHPHIKVPRRPADVEPGRRAAQAARSCGLRPKMPRTRSQIRSKPLGSMSTVSGSKGGRPGMSSRAEYGLTGASWAAPVCGGAAFADEASCEDEDPVTMGSILSRAGAGPARWPRRRKGCCEAAAERCCRGAPRGLNEPANVGMEPCAAGTRRMRPGTGRPRRARTRSRRRAPAPARDLARAAEAR